MPNIVHRESLNFYHKKFTNDITTLIAILVVSDRRMEAQEIATLVRADWDDKEFHDAIENSLKGIVPDPWP